MTDTDFIVLELGEHNFTLVYIFNLNIKIKYTIVKFSVPTLIDIY